MEDIQTKTEEEKQEKSKLIEELTTKVRKTEKAKFNLEVTSKDVLNEVRTRLYSDIKDQ